LSLKKYYEKDIDNKVSLMQKICSSKINEKGNIENHIFELTNLFQRLIDLGEAQFSKR